MFIDLSECEALLSYAALHLTPAERAAVIRGADLSMDGKLNRTEFCLLCVKVSGALLYLLRIA